MDDFRRRFTREYLDEIKHLLDDIREDVVVKLDRLARILLHARDHRNTIFVMGNGGSAATASHFVGDLSKGTLVEGFPRFRAISLTDNIPNLLAWANDKSYDDIFVEQLKNLMQSGDVVIGISGSGNSPNVIKAIEYANTHGAVTIGLSGYDGGHLLRSAQENIHIPSFSMVKVEDMHLLLEHLLTSMLREEQERENPEGSTRG